jgi:hypothetical protein
VSREELEARLKALKEHEWDEPWDGRHVMCSTCFTKHLTKSSVRTHKPHCVYAAMIRETVDSIREIDKAAAEAGAVSC